MAKNYASIYASTNDSSALEQRFYLKEETTRGTFIAPAGADFFFTLGGGSVNFSQPLMSSPHRSGRHNNNTIKEKKAVEWSFPTFINIDVDVAAGTTELEPAMRVLWKSLLGKETVSSGLQYNSVNNPSITFTILEVGDMWSKQTVGCFVDSCEISCPGDGQAQLAWSGAGKTSVNVGIGKSITDNDAGQTVTLATGEGKRFPVGSYVMLIEADGVTRSADTSAAPRKVTVVAGDVITLDGAVLADSDGSTTPIYVAYWEPATAVGIDNPQTGLVGSFSIDTYTGLETLRNATISITNGHELVNYGFGTDSLSGSLFVPGSRLEVSCSLEMNLNHDLVEYLNKVQEFAAHDIQINVGDSGDRHLCIDLPKVIFSVPSISVPDSGSVPVTFEGIAYQSTLDAADEITVSYK